MQSPLRALSKDRAAWAVTALGLACLLPTLLPGLPAAFVATFDDRLSDPVMIAAVLAVVGLRAVRVEAPRERRFWGLAGGGLACWFGVQAFDAFVPLSGVEGAALQLRNLLYVGLYVFLVLALDARPHTAGDASPSALWRLRAEVAAVLVLGLGLFTYFSVIPEVGGTSTAASRNVHSALLFLVFDAYLVLKTVEALRETADARWRGTWGLLLVTELSWLASDGMEGLWRAGIVPEALAQAVLNTVWLPPFLGLAYAARLGAVAERGGETDGRPAPGRARPVSGPLWLHAGALPVVHVLLDAGGALDREVAGVQGVCALVVFALNAALADVARRKLETDSARLGEARRRAESAERLAFVDPRTGLPSRNRGLQRLEALESEERRLVSTVALVDVDRFRAVNETFGNAAGDELLRGVAERLRGVLRESDFLGRLWDDEFLVVATGLGEPGDCRRVGRQLLEVFSAPFRVAETDLLVTATVGVTRFPAGGQTVAALLRGVDGAVRRGKAAGGDRVEVFDPVVHVVPLRAAELATSLRRSEPADFALLYRPVAELPGMAVVGLEAVPHWKHPERGLLPPEEFREAAEVSGTLARLTPWLLGEACRALEAWPSHGPLLRSVTVRLSPRQVLDVELPRYVQAALRRSGLDGRSLVLGLPESLAARHVDRALRGLHDLKALGVRISVEGFGRGEGSLAALRELPLDFLEIDGSFVRGLGESDADEGVVETALAVARSLRLVAVADGVETERQLEVLLAHDCRRAKGRLFGEPVPAEALGVYLDRLRAESLPS